MQSYYKEIKFWVYKGRKTRAPKNGWKNSSFVNFRHRELGKKNLNFFSFEIVWQWIFLLHLDVAEGALPISGFGPRKLQLREKRPFSFLYSFFFVPYCCKLFSDLFIIFSLILVKNLISFLLLAAMQRPNVLSLVSSLSYRAFWWRFWVLWCQEVSLMSILKDIRSINVVSTS